MGSPEFPLGNTVFLGDVGTFGGLKSVLCQHDGNAHQPGQCQCAPTGAVSEQHLLLKQVEHILASTGVSGTSVVWDLRQKRPVISFTDSATKTSRSCLAWNPEIATQVPTLYSSTSRQVRQLEPLTT